MKKAEITVYLSLVFILLLSFVAAMIESASIQTAKNLKRADTNRAIESVFAEYQKELLEEYDLLALEGSYETGHYEEAAVAGRLSFYGAGSMEHKVKRIQFLTDNGCQAFYEQVAAYMRHKYGLKALEEKLGTTALWKQQKDKEEDIKQEENGSRKQLDSLLKESEAELPPEDNPIAHVDTLKRTPLLDIIVPKEMQISEKSLQLEGILSRRARNQGYGDFSDVSGSDGTISKLLLGEYLLEHFTSAAKNEKTKTLDYELEYILSGKSSDRENLADAVNKLMAIRFVPNYLYIQSDGEMKAEAKAMALTLCTLAALPAVSEAAAQGILLAWAFGETVVDLRSLLKGGKIPAVKSKESWQLQLSELLTLGTGEDRVSAMDHQDGLEYNEYLRMLIFLEEKEQIGIRALDLIEQNLKNEKGLSFFKADQCISKIEVDTCCPLRRGIEYRFSTYFGYN